jgi:hypothetical protein
MVEQQSFPYAYQLVSSEQEAHVALRAERQGRGLSLPASMITDSKPSDQGEQQR